MLNNWISYTYLVICLFLPISANSQSLFDQANQAYVDEAYEKACSLYDSILSQGLSSAEVHYNLANVAFRLDKYGKAILHYEKAIKLNPAMDDAQFNLKIVRSKLPFKQSDIIDKGFASTVLARTSDYWAWVTVLLFFFAALFFALYLFSKTIRLRKLILSTILISMTLGAFCLLIAFWQHTNTHITRGVITNPVINVLLEPRDNAKTSFVLEEGATVKINETRNGYVEIQFDREKKGWIKESDVEKV